MKSASNTLPDQPINDLTAGIDWAVADHAVCVVDGRGHRVDQTLVEHTADGLRKLIKFLIDHGVGEVAIERPDGPIVDALLQADLTVVVISPNQVKNLRGRYGSAGNKDDRFDAFVLADTLRTDRPRLRPLIPDTAATVALRRACRTRKDLVAHRVAVANQLRSHLGNVFPGAVGLFKDLDSKISIAFLTRFPTQDQADWLTPKRLGDWLTKQGYSGKVPPTKLHGRLAAAARGITGSDAETQAHITHALLAILTTLVEQIAALTAQIDRQLHTHADQHIFTSLPRAGRVRAARLLAEIGDCRARFPTPNRWPVWPVPHPPPGNRANSAPSPSAGPATNNSATLSPTSPATADTPTPGPPTSTNEPAPEDTTTPTPSASSPEPGCT
ncbi:Transposase [Microlunatus soli]|uniref:Transposase n=1 Tax=Microlunatus soli TaxID=630515 RepID=A0A1H1ZSN3_9ACTN|nr:Transposase [Microlunatus soli]